MTGSPSPAPIVLVSNRGPVSFSRSAAGERTLNRGDGGLVTALRGLDAELSGGVWVCGALNDEDRLVAEEHGTSFEVALSGRKYSVRLVASDEEERRKYYSVIANPLLWFIQHRLWDLGNAPDITDREIDAFEHGYVRVNRQFADVVAEEVNSRGGRALIMLHDYHFYLLPAELRRRCPDAFLYHFIHIPWPHPDAWRVLPSHIRDPLLEGLLGSDLIAFHTERYAYNFLLTCQDLLGLDVSFRDHCAFVNGRRLAVRWYPISIDTESFEEVAGSTEVREFERRLENIRREHLILRVDRTDLSKNVLRGFLAFETMLREHPDLTGRVTFLALLQPSRQDVPQYVDYVERIRRLVADINLTHGNSEWQPIDLRFDDEWSQVIAAYRLFDVLLVNPVYDGMNLVAKEGMLVNQRHGVLVLSEHAGVHDELGAFALSVHPFDIGQQADALYQALVMPGAERRERREACVEVVRHNDIHKWLRAQLQDIEELSRV